MSSSGRRRFPIVGVMGSGTASHEPLASSLGAALATLDVHLLTGGGQGVMASVSRAFFDVPGRRGLVLGVVPGDGTSGEPPPGYPNEWVEIVVRTHLPLSGEHGAEPMSRNHLNVLSSDVVVALPGGPGTCSEVELALRYGRPVVAFGAARFDFSGFPEGVQVSTRLGDVVEFVEDAVEA